MAGERSLWTILFIVAIVAAIVFFIVPKDIASAGVCALLAIAFIQARGQASA